MRDAAVWLLLAGAAMTPGPAGSQQDGAAPLVLTTDTPEYCEKLAQDLSERARYAPMPEVVVALSAEGRRLCARGQVRGGVMRLRLAIVLLGPPPSPH